MKKQVPWFRLYTEARTDAKLRALSDAEHRVWFHLLCFAAEQLDEWRGSLPLVTSRYTALQNDTPVTYDDEVLAVEVAGGDIELFRSTLCRLEKLKIVGVTSEAITFLKFQKRQYDYPSDSRERVRERVSKSRAQARVASDSLGYRNSNEHVTSRNGKVTGGNGLDIDIDIDRDIDTSVKEKEHTKYKNGGKDGSPQKRAKTTPSNQLLKKSKDDREIIQQLPPHVVEQFAPEQIQEETRKASAWYSSSEREHPMPLDAEHLKNWLLRIPASNRQKPNETEVERLARILASWDRIKNEKGLVDGLTWNSYNEKLITAREAEKTQRYEENRRAQATLYPQETDVVQQNGAHPPPTDG